MNRDPITIVICFVGATLLGALAGIIYLAATTAGPVPDVLQNIAVGCLTGLVGLLVPANLRRGS